MRLSSKNIIDGRGKCLGLGLVTAMVLIVNSSFIFFTFLDLPFLVISELRFMQTRLNWVLDCSVIDNDLDQN